MAYVDRQGLSVRAAARIYGVDRGLIRSAIARGDLPAARFGTRRFLILRADVETWIRSMRVVPASTAARVQAEARVERRVAHEEA